MTFGTLGMAPPKRRSSITGGHDNHANQHHPTVLLVHRGLQPNGLICHVEVFQVSMTTEENPAQVTDFPVLPSANPSCALRILPLGVVESQSDDRR